MPRPATSRPAAPVNADVSFAAWKAEAVTVLAELHERAATATRDGVWTRLYVRGLDPDDAAKVAASDYVERPAVGPHALKQRPRPSGFVEPSLCTRADCVPDGPQWAHEIKHDGYRFIVRRDGDRVRVFSRHGLDWTDRVPAIVEAMLALRTTAAVLDGEAVVARDDGVTDFAALRSALASRTGRGDVFLYAFDLIEADGYDMRREPWHARRDALAELLVGAPGGVVLSEHLHGDGAAIFRHACALGLEGIVSKRRDAPYRSGRCADWIKIKNPTAPAATRVMEW